MKNDILTPKLRHFAEIGNIEMERCVEIAQAANNAIIEQSKGGDLPQMAAAMFRCCGSDEDEAAYFRCAVDSLLQERWGAKPEDSAVLTYAMNMSYQGIWSALRAGQEEDDDETPEVEERPIFRVQIHPGVVKFNQWLDSLNFGISIDRHQWIIDHAEAAAKSYAKAPKSGMSLQDFDGLATPMLNCCNSTEELKFFSYAVKSFLCENGFNEENATLTTNGMGHRAIQIAEARRNGQVKKSSAGCLVMIVASGILPLWIYVTCMLFA